MKYQILRRPIGASSRENEFYDEFDCTAAAAQELVVRLRAASGEWWYTTRETRLAPIEDRRRFW